MSAPLRLLLGLTMTLALLAGFLHSLWPEALVSFKRLHIFLFNLCSGGALILYFTEGKNTFSPKVRLFFFLTLLYAFAAAAGWYIPAMLLSIPVVLIVESVRIERFSFFPFDFFSPETSVSSKFNHASLLCLSCGLVIASLVILNNEYLRLVSYEKLTLEVFFLGYSFPISLITMSVMFSFMTNRQSLLVAILMELSFWLVNLGVIIFFVFIILGLFIPEITMAITLFLSVCMIFYLFLMTAPRIQQKAFLTSGMVFLMFTGFTGILYILRYFVPVFDRYHEIVLLLHAMVSLYGWNLSGLFIIIRWDDFPIQLNSGYAIVLHWIIVLVLVPLGRYFSPLAPFIILAYVALLGIVFMGRSTREVPG